MDSHRSTYCHYRSFSNQMMLLRLLGFRVIDMNNAIDILKGHKKSSTKTVVLTFDDGYENFYEYAYPCLKRHKFPAIVYILAGFLGQKAEWFASDGRECPPLMDIARIQFLHNQGIQFGSHGISHRKLAEISLEEAQREIVESKIALEKSLGMNIDHFCYPYGSHNYEIVQTVKQAGYKSAVTCVRGRAKLGNDLYQLPRKAISFGDSLIGFAWKLLIKNRRKTPELKA